MHEQGDDERLPIAEKCDACLAGQGLDMEVGKFGTFKGFLSGRAVKVDF